MRIVVLAGGVGGARFLLGVRKWAGEHGAEVTAVVNVGDDVTLYGLRVCPDLDSVLYTLGGGADPERGWGRAGETWIVRDELARYGAEPTWFGLGDRDFATHLVRTEMLRAGVPLSGVTAALARRWRPGVRILPATDDRVETHVVVAAADPAAGPASVGAVAESTATVALAAGEQMLHFQEWWVRYRGALPARRFVYVGADEAVPAPGVTGALARADLVLLAPSNPVVSISPILAVPQLRAAVRDTPAPVVGLSPIIAGAAVRGMAEQCLGPLGVPVTAAGVGRYYGARAAGGILDGWLVDTVDAGASVPGVRVRAIPLWMTDPATTARMVAAAADLAREAR